MRPKSPFRDIPAGTLWSRFRRASAPEERGFETSSGPRRCAKPCRPAIWPVQRDERTCTLRVRGPFGPGERMQNLDREHAGAFRLRWIGLIGAALAAVAFVSPASPAAA